ncbi:MAG: APC family permease, partial [Acidobacteria bacterium]
VNGLGALVTGITVIVVLVAKFVEGAWITLLFIPLTIAFFIAVRRHYHSVRMLTSCRVPVRTASLSQSPIVVIPIDRWSNITRQGIEFAARLSSEVIAIHVEPTEHSELLQAEWEHYVERPFRAAGKEPPKLHFLPSPYRFVIVPTVQFILDVSNKNPARSIIVVIPELVENKWYEYFLHNQRGRLLEWVLLARGNERIFAVSAPWHIGERTQPIHS